MMMGIQRSRPPQPVVWAVAATVINGVAGFLLGLFWPDLDDRATIITVSAILAVVMLASSLWLWRGARWGAIAALAVNAFNILLSVPAVFQDDAALLVMGAISALLSLAALVLILRPESRSFWQRGAKPSLAPSS